MNKKKNKKMSKKMRERMNKNVLLAVLVILFILGAVIKVLSPNPKINDVIDEAQDMVIKEILVSEETEELAIQTKEAINKNEDLSTKETIKSSVKEEEMLEEEQLEKDATVEQENIAYNGDISGKGLKLLGKTTKLTYYSQADKRWAKKLYTSTNNKTQTIKSSGCGPTSAAMVVSSSKGAILPSTMANLFVDNGFRTANSGTAWSAYSFVADFFDFKEYYTTGSFDKAMKYLGTDKNKDGKPDYYIIASCGSGLFTTGGHYIVLADLDKSTIKVYDPYLYSGKFNTASRRNAKVKVKGNSVYVTKSNFKKYANYKHFWVFSNDSVVKKKSKKATKTTKKKSVKKSTVGKTKKLKSKCYLYSKSNLKGKKYTYKKNTTIKILKNVSSKVDKVKVKYTGRIAYIRNNSYK